MYLMYRSVGNTRLDCCSIFSIACLLFLRLLSLHLWPRPYRLSQVDHILSPFQPPHPPTQEWFNVQLNLSKAIDARCVMIPADLQMELLIPLSLLSSPPPSSSSFLFLRHNISGLFFLDPSPRAPFVVRVLWVPCCSSNKNRDEKKKTHKKMNKQTGLSDPGKARTKGTCEMDHS